MTGGFSFYCHRKLLKFTETIGTVCLNHGIWGKFGDGRGGFVVFHDFSGSVERKKTDGNGARFWRIRPVWMEFVGISVVFKLSR